MTWFRRGHSDGASSATSVAGGAGDSGPPTVEQLLAEIFAANRYINQHSGHLPGAAVVTARAVTDQLRQILDTVDDVAQDVQAMLFVEGTVRDYLPTTLKTYLAVDPSLANTARGSGETPTAALSTQLRMLRTSADATLVAAREHDVDTLLTQGNFLSTKFTRSDLDL